MLASASLREEAVEGVFAAADGLVGEHLDAVLEAVSYYTANALPARPAGKNRL